MIAKLSIAKKRSKKDKKGFFGNFLHKQNYFYIVNKFFTKTFIT